jgi:NAD(P)-dependent dehydrogenase (short-subunit alcohol dehydrogenase family)
VDRPRAAVVTGAGSGIGRALAGRLRSRYERLVVADVDEVALRAVADELGATPVVTDVSDPAAVEHLAEVAGAPGLLCLNAGVLGQDLGAPWESSPDDWRRVLDVNVGGVVNGLRAFVPRMLAAEGAGGILVTASLAGLLTWPGGGPYGASKHAVVAVAEAAALALAETQVHVTALCPALVRTGMSEVGEDPVDVADQALAAVERGDFLVVPDEWRAAISARAAGLLTGDQPTVPLPSDAGPMEDR